MNDFNLDDIGALITTDPPPTGDRFLDLRYDVGMTIHDNPCYYYRLFYQIAQALKPEMVVELGGWQGTAAAHFAGAGAGTVATIDHHSDPGDDVHRERMLEAVQNYANLFYFQGWTWDVIPEVKALGKKIDVLFIDSWHVYEYAIPDWEGYSPLLSNPALVICDDIQPDNGSTIQGMERFWAEISHGREAFLSNVPHPGCPMGFMKWIG